MTDVVPVERKQRSTDDARPKAKPKKQQVQKDSKSSRARESGAVESTRVRDDADSANATAGRKKDPSNGGSAGADRTAAPVPGNPRPRYPQVARTRGHEGRVLIRVSVLGDGRVGSAAVSRSSGHGSLDRAALKAVKRWRFEPALRAGRPVTATLTVPVVFRLEG